MHLIEALSTSCGLKISEPYIYEKYCALNSDKYILIETNNIKNPTQDYDYWQDVINLILEDLNKNNIKIIQLCGEKDRRLVNAYTIVNLNYNQKAFLIRNSLLYIGSNTFGLNVASHFNKKIIALYGNVLPSQNQPYWSKKEDIEILKGFENKPSFGINETNKDINNTTPDSIAKSILKLLKIKDNIRFKYLKIFNHYINKTIQVVPNMILNPNSLGIDSTIVRMDLEFNEKILEEHLKICKCIIVSNKSISQNLLLKYKMNILQFIYIVENDNDPEFIKFVKGCNINLVLTSYLEQSEIDKIKINYMDLGLIINVKNNIKFEEIKPKYYKSNSFILSNNKLYMSEAGVLNNLPIKDFDKNIQEIIDTDIFWKYAQNYAFLIDS